MKHISYCYYYFLHYLKGGDQRSGLNFRRSYALLIKQTLDTLNPIPGGCIWLEAFSSLRRSMASCRSAFIVAYVVAMEQLAE